MTSNVPPLTISILSQSDIHLPHFHPEVLLSSVPKLDQKKDEKLKPIKGNPPDMSHVRPGCAFAPRCGCAMQICVKEEAPMCELDDTHKVSCWQVVRHEMEEQKR